MKKYFLYVICGIWASVSACDDGKIYDSAVSVTGKGRTVKLTADVRGMDSWPEGYNVVVAGFDATSEFAIVSKTVAISEEEGKQKTVILTGLSQEVTQVELCMINKLRRRILTFYEQECGNTTDTLLIEAGVVDAGMFEVIQKQVFDNYCTACHGNSTQAGAGLYLTAGRSHDALVGQNSRKGINGQLLVKPGDAADSFLPIVLDSHESADWRTDHSGILPSEIWISVIKSWIDHGAKE